MSTVIESFSGDYAFLSNFYRTEVEYQGDIYQSAQAAFQASKVLSPEIRSEFTSLSAAEATLKGDKIAPSIEWEQNKQVIMYKILKNKFSKNKELRSLLMKTNISPIIHKNNWHENYWGECTCEECVEKEKHNYLGKILVKVREDLRTESFLEAYLKRNDNGN
jgi:ribA/ribD-fused uncharacterized protein